MRSSSRAHIPVSDSNPLARLMSDTYKQMNVSGKLYLAYSMGELLKEGDKANRMPVALGRTDTLYLMAKPAKVSSFVTCIEQL